MRCGDEAWKVRASSVKRLGVIAGTNRASGVRARAPAAAHEAAREAHEAASDFPGLMLQLGVVVVTESNCRAYGAYLVGHSLLSKHLHLNHFLNLAFNFLDDFIGRGDIHILSISSKWGESPVRRGLLDIDIVWLIACKILTLALIFC